MMLVIGLIVLVTPLAAYVAVRLIVRAQAHEPDPSRGPVHFEHGRSTAEMLKSLAPGQQPKGKP